jgi:hypothetical protein
MGSGPLTVLKPLATAGLCAAMSFGCTASRYCADCVPPRSFGCSYHPCCDKLLTKFTADQCARKDLKAWEKDCGKQSRHFAAGFHEAYRDLALGRLAQLPPVPPSRYWTAYYRSCAGQKDVQDWFAGYEAGLEWGWNSGVSRFNRVASTLGGVGGMSAHEAWDAAGSASLPVQAAPFEPASVAAPHPSPAYCGQ